MRIFIAALLPEEIKTHIADYLDSIKNRIDGVKWESYEKFHITLKFLGEVKDEKQIEINDKLVELTLDKSKIRLGLTNFGGFPNLSRPRILHVGFNESKIITDMQQSIDYELSSIGFDKDRRGFTPHITIGRVKSKFNISPHLPMIEEKKFFIEDIAVVQSFIGNKGSIYKNLNVYKLK